MEQSPAGLASEKLSSWRQSTRLVSGRDRSWPWQPELREPPPELEGDLDEAIAFGLAHDLAGLRHLTAMLTSAIVVPCTARWTVDPDRVCTLAVDHPEAKLLQMFHRTHSGLELEFGLLELPRSDRRQGYGRRMVRNLAIVLRELGVRYVKAYAGNTDGAIVWAKLGASPVDPEAERASLLRRLQERYAELGIDESYLEDFAEVIKERAGPIAYAEGRGS